MQMNIPEAKANLSELIAAVERGEEVIIARGGQPVVRLVPVHARGGRLGLLKGLVPVESMPDFLERRPQDEMAEWDACLSIHPDVAAAIERAQVRGAVRVAEILEQPEMLSAADIGELMGITRQAVDEAWQAGHLLAVSGGERTNSYPAWQLDNSGVPMQGLAEIIALLGNGWLAFRFLAAADINEQPRYARLAAGEVTTVLQEAQAASNGDFV